MVKGVVRGRPLILPRMVTSTLGPIGMPAARRHLAMGLKSGTNHGTWVDLICPAMMKNLLALTHSCSYVSAPSLVASFADVPHCSREKRGNARTNDLPSLLFIEPDCSVPF